MAERSDTSLRLMLGVLMLVYVFNFLDRQIMAILAEPIARELHLDDTEIGVMTGLVFALFYTVLGLPIARFADRPHTNRVKVIAAAVALWSVMTALCGVAQTFTQMLVARVGVGVGEAGGTPPAHSLIADRAPPERRASAMAAYQLGPPIGGLIGMVTGGLIAQAYGWRRAFLVVGLPGLLLSLAVLLLLRDPRFSAAGAERRRVAAGITARTGEASVAGGQSAMTTMEALRHIFAGKAMRRLLLVAAIGPLSGYGLLIFGAVFFQRVHHLTVGQAGVTFGVVNGLAMASGVWLGGMLGDRMRRRDPRQIMTWPSLAFMASAPLTVAALFAPSALTANLLFFPAILLLYLYVGPYYSAVQGLVRPQARAVASATVLFLQNLLGLGLGPVVLGYISDSLKPTYGAESIRYAMAIATIFALIAAFILWSSRKYLAEELDRYE